MKQKRWRISGVEPMIFPMGHREVSGRCGEYRSRTDDLPDVSSGRSSLADQCLDEPPALLAFDFLFTPHCRATIYGRLRIHKHPWHAGTGKSPSLTAIVFMKSVVQIESVTDIVLVALLGIENVNIIITHNGALYFGQKLWRISESNR
jgi:hypothetical protein